MRWRCYLIMKNLMLISLYCWFMLNLRRNIGVLIYNWVWFCLYYVVGYKLKFYVNKELLIWLSNDNFEFILGMMERC